MPNHLAGEASPYLLEHAENPVDWYPWGEEAFEKARREDKPVFLSIGYSTCHWCRVMARESFGDAEVAALLNEGFVSVKVDREERPDLDRVYMEACRTFSGGAGWPMTLFLTPEGEPVFAGTYFPKASRPGRMGLLELLALVKEKWEKDRSSLREGAGKLLERLREQRKVPPAAKAADGTLIENALWLLLRSFDPNWGGFSEAPKFPMPHLCLFLLQQYEKRGDERLRRMAETTLSAMAAGGIQDQIGGGFCRYATDRAWRIPHFEKMLADNALLILTYARAFRVTGRPLWLRTARRTADWLLRELRSPQGAFFTALDADSEGEEGKHYLFTPAELMELLGPEEGAAFCAWYRITEAGELEGKSVPNRVGLAPDEGEMDALLPRVLAYRRRRCPLPADDKILLGWNSLAVTALCTLYRVSRAEKYLDAAREAQAFLDGNLRERDRLFASFRAGKRGAPAFLDDCAARLLALLALQGATLEGGYLDEAERLAARTFADFWDEAEGGFFLSGREGEKLVLQPKESYDGAHPSGNSLMALALVRLNALRPDPEREERTARLLDWLGDRARMDPAGHAAYLTALSDLLEPPPRVIAAVERWEETSELPFLVPPEAALSVTAPTEEYPLLRGRSAYYVCLADRCLPPSAELRLK